jgi:hypothetical protein
VSQFQILIFVQMLSYGLVLFTIGLATWWVVDWIARFLIQPKYASRAATTIVSLLLILFSLASMANGSPLSIFSLLAGLVSLLFVLGAVRSIKRRRTARMNVSDLASNAGIFNG